MCSGSGIEPVPTIAEDPIAPGPHLQPKIEYGPDPEHAYVTVVSTAVANLMRQVHAEEDNQVKAILHTAYLCGYRDGGRGRDPHFDAFLDDLIHGRIDLE